LRASNTFAFNYRAALAKLMFAVMFAQQIKNERPRVLSANDKCSRAAEKMGVGYSLLSLATFRLCSLPTQK